MPLQKLTFRPGVNREGTNYSNEGGWYDCDKIRFRSGQAEKIGGWVQLASATFLGVCRALWSWVDLTGQNKYIGVGTNLKYYIQKSSTYYDITPIRKTVNPMANNPFSTSYSTLAAGLNATADVLTLTSTATFLNYPGVIQIDTEQIRFTGVSGSTLINLTRGYNGTTAASHLNGAAVGCSTITVTDVANGATPDDFVTFSGATAVNTVFTTALLNAEQQIVNTDTPTNTYTIVIPGVFSTAAVSGGGAAVVAAYQITTGLPIYQIGDGWGAGAWGAGGWGSASPTSTIAQQLLLWSNDNFGQDLLIAQRGGAIYYWQQSLGLGTRAVSLQSLANTTTAVTDASTFSAGAETMSVTTAGTGYANNTYPAVPLTYVSGPTMTTYPTATIVVAGGIVTSVTPTGGNSGTGATATGTVLTTANVNLGGGVVTALGAVTPGTGYTNGTYVGIQLSYVSGPTMATYPKATVVVAGGVVSTVTLTDGGTGATGTGTVLTASNALIGGTGSGFQIPTTTIVGLGFTGTVTALQGATSINVTPANAPYIFPNMYVTGASIPAGAKVSSSYVTGNTVVPITGFETTASSSGTYNFSYAGDFIPNNTNQIVASAIQRFVIAFGANSYSPNDANTAFNPMLVRWSDQSNPYQWVPQLTNQSGEFLLTNGSYIMGARTTRQEILVWTDACLYSMQYLGPPYVWGFQVLMDNISVMSPNSMITVNNVTYWMGQEKFYMYSGRVDTLPCSLRQYVFDNINKDQSYQIFAGANEGFNEVWWFYCSQDSTVVDSYVIYNYLDKVWYYGTMGRTAWLEVGINPQPVAADYNNRLLNHEVGTDDFSGSNAAPIDAYIQSSDFDIGDGHNFGFVWRILPDINFNNSNMSDATSPYPSVTMTVKPRQNSGTPYGTANNPVVNSQDDYALRHAYNIQEFDGQVYTRLRGRQMSFRIESDRIGVAWQLGVPRIDIRPDGRR